MADDALRLVLPGRLEPSGLPDLQAAIDAARGADLILDASAVERLGGQGLQLLLSALRSWREDGFSLGLADPSPAALEALRRLGAPLDDLTRTEPSA